MIQIPLSGGDRKAQANELRRARGLTTKWIYKQEGMSFSIKGGTLGQKAELHFVALIPQYDPAATFRLSCQEGIITPLIAIELPEPMGSSDDGGVIAR
jgi:hypothetical protein